MERVFNSHWRIANGIRMGQSMIVDSAASENVAIDVLMCQKNTRVNGVVVEIADGSKVTAYHSGIVCLDVTTVRPTVTFLFYITNLSPNNLPCFRLDYEGGKSTISRNLYNCVD